MLDYDAILRARIEEQGADEDRLERLAILLRRELDQIAEASFSKTDDEAPGGSKGIDGAVLSDIVVAIAGSSVLVEVVRTIGAWVSRGDGRRVTVTYGGSSLELSSASQKDQELLIEEFVINTRKSGLADTE